MLARLVVLAASLAASAAFGQAVTPEARALIERFRDQPPAAPGAARGAPAPVPELLRRPPPGTTRPPMMSEESTAPRGVVAVSLYVHFDTGSSALTPAARAALSHVGLALASQELSKMRCLIEGHADRVGSPGMNQLLSVQRAEAVRDHLVVTYGIAPDRLMTAGRGESDPLVPTADEVPEWRNRRVQLLKVGTAA